MKIFNWQQLGRQKPNFSLWQALQLFGFDLFVIRWTPSDHYNTSSFSFSTVLFSLWSHDTFGLAAHVELEPWKAYVQIKVPYLHIRFGFDFYSDFLSRKSADRKAFD